MKLYQNKDWLYEKYVIEGLSIKKIAKLCGVARFKIKDALSTHRIEKKSTGGQVKFKGARYIYKRYLYHQYHILKLTTYEIAKNNNVGESTIRRWMDFHEMKRRDCQKAQQLKYQKCGYPAHMKKIEPGWLWLLKNGFAHRVPKEIREEFQRVTI